jgi:Ca-activated chloride channel family protein
MEDRKYRNYVFAKRGEVVTFRAPDEPGKYELRYIDGATYNALERVPITILETTATVEAPSEVVAGSEFKVLWTGPDNRQDFITIIQANANEGKYKNYTYTKRAKKDRDGNLYVNLKAPDDAGSYEVRYLSPEVTAGSNINIYWTGPDNHRDLITIIEADAEEGKYGKYSYLNKSNKDRDGNSYITLSAPDEAGYFESTEL